ncbi:cell division protein ZapA [candidate division WOR-3 bacterium]|nr:cell division protein ZapA [candidate division WOR-3 bacterium]
MEENIIDTVIGGKKISLKVSENFQIIKEAIELLKRELDEIQNSPTPPMSQEEAFLIAALNIAGALVKEKSGKPFRDFELSPELLKKIDNAVN